MENKPRKPWVAGILTFIMPGLGNVYCGQWKRGATVYVLYWLATLGLGAFAVWVPVVKANLIIPLLSWVSVYFYFISDSVRVARDSSNPYILQGYNRWYYYLLIIIGVGILTGIVEKQFVGKYIYREYKIAAESMAPTLLIGEHILADKLTHRFSKLRRGELVVFLYPEDETKEFLKRIVGMPGDEIHILNKGLFINGRGVKEKTFTQHVDPGIIDRRISPRDNYGPVTLPKGKYFMMGDNREQSLDSRFFGLVDESKITGRIKTIYWSSAGDWPLEGVRWNRIGSQMCQIFNLGQSGIRFELKTNPIQCF